MIQINEIHKIDNFDKTLKRRGDLIYYDGPILSHFIDDSNYKHYFYLHIDNDDIYNRWLIFSIDSIDDFKRFLNGYVSLQYLIDSSKSTYIADIDNELKKIFFKIDKVYLKDFELDYSILYSNTQCINLEYKNYLTDIIFNPRLSALTNDQIIEICKLISSVESDVNIVRDSNMITCKFIDDVEDIVFINIRTDYEHESSNKKIIDRVSFTKNEISNNEELPNYIGFSESQLAKLERIRLIETYEETRFPLSQGELLDVFKYLQSIRIKI